MQTQISSKLQCFAHINAPNAALYGEILTAFAKARVEFQLNLRAAEVVSRLAGAHGEEDVAAALDQLCSWGNLEAFHDNSQALSLQEFYRRHLYYQLTGPGVAALRAIELFHQLVETPASLQATALAAVRDRLAELIGMAKAQEHDAAIDFDVAKFTELANLTNQAQEFFRGLQATVELRETSVDAFLSFKDRLVHYLERFLNQVVTVAGEAETLIETTDEMMIDALLHSIARHRTVDELDVTLQRIEQVQHQLRARWLGVVGWFIAPRGRTSQADELRSLARTGIREVAAAATRLNRGRGGVVDRSADFRRLAIWFANCVDARAAHRLWRTAFAVSPARHLTVSDATLAEREQSPVSATRSWAESPPLRIAPTLRQSGRVARSSRTPRLIMLHVT
ncbi:MAG: TIGR02677 family protein [Planctomycetia bacterium]|nr:TIGR02677 family protein [Planctomycetia bacterium]